jgi:hypothetical protein
VLWCFRRRCPQDRCRPGRQIRDWAGKEFRSGELELAGIAAERDILGTGGPNLQRRPVGYRQGALTGAGLVKRHVRPVEGRVAGAVGDNRRHRLNLAIGQARRPDIDRPAAVILNRPGIGLSIQRRRDGLAGKIGQIGVAAGAAPSTDVDR